MRLRWRLGAVAAAGLIVAAVSGCGATGSSAGSCAAKQIELTDSTLRPGGEVDFHVDWMTATCEDTGGTNVAATNLEVTITPTSTGKAFLLGTIDAGPAPRFTAGGRFGLPADLPPGDATLRVVSHVGDKMSAALPVTVAAD